MNQKNRQKALKAYCPNTFSMDAKGIEFFRQTKDCHFEISGLMGVH